MKNLFRSCVLRSALFLAFFYLYSCDQDHPVDESLHGSEQFNRTIRFNVINVYSFTPLMDSVVEGATISVYTDYYDFLTEAYPDASRVTDSLGECEIAGLDGDYYYVRAQHPAFDDVIDSVNTPPNTTSFVTMIFY